MSSQDVARERTASRVGSPGSYARVHDTLRALGGQATLGDIVAVAGLPCEEVEDSLEALMASDRGHVKVSGSGAVIYHLGKRGPEPALRGRPEASAPGQLRPPAKGFSDTRQVKFDRKTIQLIRAREGVISMAELVEHTGLPLAEAEEEMQRLAECYGGEAYPSWDGHIVHAFPQLMVSAHGRFPDREPRPAWVRAEDPVRRAKQSRHSETLRLVGNGAGLLSSVLVLSSVFSMLGGEVLPVLLGVGGLGSALGVYVFGRGLLSVLPHHRLFRFRQARTLRRYALGLVFETALAGKGVVSLSRMVEHLQARAGKQKVRRSTVEAALRELAREFDAPITEVDGELFFGFRNVKRQFLASHVQRRRLQLGRTASGRTVFNSADSPLAATARDLELFDRELRQRYPVPLRLPDRA